MNLKEAIEEVLRERPGGLHTEEITKALLASGRWQTAAKTPESTVSARIYSDIKQLGEKSPFQKVAPRTFKLKDHVKESDVIDQAKQPAEISKEPLPLNNDTLSFVACAQKVLQECGDTKPMHYKQITERALARGWLVTEGKTPAATMYAQLITDIKRQQQRGAAPRFVQHGKGYFGLNQWIDRGLAYQIEQHNKQVRKALHEQLLALQPVAFEELISQLLVAMDFEMVAVTKLSGDGGIDVRGDLVIGDIIRIKMAVQVKRWKNNVQAPAIQQVRGSLRAHERGLIITTSDFSDGAIKEAVQSDKAPIALMNGDQLVLLLIEHNLGICRATTDLYEIDTSFFKAS